VELHEAERIARERIATYADEADELGLLRDETLTRAYRWVFFIKRGVFLRPVSFRKCSPATPLLVIAATGEIHEFGTVLPLEEELERFERDDGLRP
jgi:hypothetical protein